MIDADPKEYEHLSQIDRMTQGYPYDCKCLELAEVRHRSRKLFRELNGTDESDKEKRRNILKQVLSPKCAPDFYIKPGFRCDYGFNILVGENCYINYNACFLDVSLITIGKNFMCGPSCHIYTASHPLDPIRRRTLDFGLPVKIGDDVWIGGMSVICPGVTIGNGVTVGARSVVTKDVPDDCVVVGRPARIIKTLSRDMVRNATDETMLAT